MKNFDRLSATISSVRAGRCEMSIEWISPCEARYMTS